MTATNTTSNSSTINGFELNSQTRTNIFIMYLAVFLDMMGFSVIAPVLPFYAAEEKFGANSVQLGLLMTSFSIASTISTLIKGKLSDTFGRTPMILLSLFGTFFGFLLIAFAQTYNQLLIFRIINGSFGFASPICKAYIIDVIPTSLQSSYFGYLGGTIAVAYVIGPIIGVGMMKLLSIRASYLTASTLGAIGFVISLFKLKESNKSGLINNEDVSEDVNIKIEQSANVNTHKSNKIPYILYVLATSQFLQVMAMAAYTSMYTECLRKFHNYEALGVGFSITPIAILYSITCGFIFNKIQKKIGLKNIPILGSFICCVFMVISTITSTKYVLIGIMFMGISIGIGHALFAMSTPSIAAYYTNHTNRGKIMSLMDAMDSATYIIGPYSFGHLLEKGQSYPFLCGAFCSFVAFIFGIGLKQKHKRIK
eukprot:199904_1